MFWGLLISCFLSIFVGATFDICGRKPVLAVAYAVLVAVIWTMPYLPTINWLIVNRIGLTLAMQFLHAHPLVIDYIKSESRGKATAAQNIGNLIGEAFAMIVLIQIQISLSIKASVWIVGTIVASLSFGVLFLVSEPRLRKLNLNLPEKSERSQEKIPLL